MRAYAMAVLGLSKCAEKVVGELSQQQVGFCWQDYLLRGVIDRDLVLFRLVPSELPFVGTKILRVTQRCTRLKAGLAGLEVKKVQLPWGVCCTIMGQHYGSRAGKSFKQVTQGREWRNETFVMRLDECFSIWSVVPSLCSDVESEIPGGRQRLKKEKERTREGNNKQQRLAFTS